MQFPWVQNTRIKKKVKAIYKVYFGSQERGRDLGVCLFVLFFLYGESEEALSLPEPHSLAYSTDVNKGLIGAGLCFS